MNQQNREHLNKCAEFLVKKLHFNPVNIMVTGSVALDIQGVLPDDREVNGVDIILKTDNKSWGCVKLLEAIFCEYELDNHTNSVFFDLGGTILNVFRYDGGDWSTIRDARTGVYVATVDNILKVKKARGSKKDICDLTGICSKILKQ